MDTLSWINILVNVVTLFGGGSLLFFTFNRKLKALEVKEKEVEVVHSQADEWKRLYEESERERKCVADEYEKLKTKHEEDIREIGKLTLNVEKLTWYRCTVQGCQKRRPPHVFDMDGNELEQKQI